jgi:hypothetical protein
MCTGSVHTLNIKSRGTSKVRAMTNSPLRGSVTERLFFSAMFSPVSALLFQANCLTIPSAIFD